ncbi:MAG: DUF6502 family protein [Paracoccaceae bacterium]
MSALDPILTPLARLAIRRGWLFKTVEKRLKHAYVTAALALGGAETTDSKISIMTGLQRRDVAALRRDPAPPEHQRQPLAEIMSLWWNDPAYASEGIPIQGDEGSFTALARSVRQDVHPRTFLDLLIDAGNVVQTGERVVLKHRSYRPVFGSDDQLTYLSDNVGDHLSAAVDNVVDGGRNYDMGVHYKGLSEAAIARLDGHFRTRMTEILTELDMMARQFPESDDGPCRFRAGAYFFDDRPDEAKSDDP